MSSQVHPEYVVVNDARKPSQVGGIGVQFERLSVWCTTHRSSFVFVCAMSVALASSYLRFHVLNATTTLAPNYQTAAWAPFVQTFRELSWFGYALSLVLAGVAVSHWVRESSQSR